MFAYLGNTPVTGQNRQYRHTGRITPTGARYHHEIRLWRTSRDGNHRRIPAKQNIPDSPRGRSGHCVTPFPAGGR